MYYNRTLSEPFAKLIKPDGDLRWLFDVVKQHQELDFLTGRNNAGEWISVYRGLSRLIRIRPTSNPNEIKVDAAQAYKELVPSIYGRKGINENFSSNLIELVQKVSESPRFFKYYNNRKEGYYQNELSRKYGICGTPTDEFVIVDKEAVIGYASQKKKDSILTPLMETYQGILNELSLSNPKRYGKNIGKKATGNELDFLAIDKQGTILLIEFKDRLSPNGIYLSPFQIGGYYDLWTQFPKDELIQAIIQMAEQKKKIGLINPEWKIPKLKDIVPVLIISEYNYKSKAKEKYYEVMEFVRARKGNSFLKNINTYTFTLQNGLNPW